MSKEAMKLAKAWFERNTYGDEAVDVYEALCAALAEQPAQQEPDWLDKQQTETDWDHVWLLIKAASYASSRGFISGTSNWGSAVSRYMRNESPQPAQPAQHTWVSLTDVEIENCYGGEINEFARAIEAKLKERNQ